MSTKSTMFYSPKTKDDPGFHFYWDFVTLDCHLEIGDKEMSIPRSFKDTLIELHSIKSSHERIDYSKKQLKKLEESGVKKKHSRK